MTTQVLLTAVSEDTFSASHGIEKRDDSFLCGLNRKKHHINMVYLASSRSFSKNDYSKKEARIMKKGNVKFLSAMEVWSFSSSLGGN